MSILVSYTYCLKNFVYLGREMTLQEITRSCYKKGYNIYSWLNRFKKDANLREDLPEEVIIRSCRIFLKAIDQSKVKVPYKYFQAIMHQNKSGYFASKQTVKDKTVNTNLLKELGL